MSWLSRMLLCSLLWCCFWPQYSPAQSADENPIMKDEPNSGITLSKSIGLILRFPISGIIVPMNKGQDGRREVKALVAQGVTPNFTFRAQNKEVFGIGPCIFLSGMESENIDMYTGITTSIFRQVHLSCVLNVEDESVAWLLGINWPV